MLQQSGARVLLVSPALAAMRDSLPSVEAIVAEPGWRQFSGLSDSNLALRSSIDSAVFLLFTSGVCKRCAVAVVCSMSGVVCKPANPCTLAVAMIATTRLLVLLQVRRASQRASACSTAAWPMSLPTSLPSSSVLASQLATGC